MLTVTCSLQHFYQNKLQDAPSIVAAPDEPFYSLQLLKPYVFFDVARGQMARGRSGASMGNQVGEPISIAAVGEEPVCGVDSMARMGVRPHVH